MPIRLSQRDKALLGRQFTIDDPRTLTGLLQTVPSGGPDPELEYRYDASPRVRSLDDKPDIWCAYCHEHNHWRGFVLIYPDGSRITVGKDCGKKHYGLVFKDWEQAFEALERRQSNLREFMDRLPRLPQVADFVRDLSKNTSYRILASTQQRLLHDFRPLVDAIGPALRNSETWLTADEPQRDFKAEELRSRRNEIAKKEWARLARTHSAAQMDRMVKRGELAAIESESKPIMTTVERRVMRVVGGNLLTADFKRQLDVFQPQSLLFDSMYSALKDRPSEGIEESMIAQFQERLTKVVRTIEDEMLEFEKMLMFFDPFQLTNLAAWASANYVCGGAYRVENGALVFSPSYGNTMELKVGLPDGFALPDRGELRRILDAPPNDAPYAEQSAA